MDNYMEEIQYYDGSKLMSIKDLNGETPEIYISQTIRSKGKTTWFNHKICEDFLNDGKVFGLLYRYAYELDDCPQILMGAVRDLYYPDIDIKSESFMGGKIRELYWSDKLCGYAFSINSYEQVKKASNTLSKIEHYLFDEAITENDEYAKNEVNKFMSIHTSISRAPGQPVRFVPVYMLANCIRMLNPYFMALNIPQRYQSRTKYLRGDGFVLETLYDKKLTIKAEQSPFNRAFKGQAYVDYLTGNNSLFINEMNDIGKQKGEKTYVYTFICDGKSYGLWRMQNGLYYLSTQFIANYKKIIGVMYNDRVMANVYDYSIAKFLKSNFKDIFNQGSMRFEDGNCKNVMLKFLLTDGRD